MDFLSASDYWHARWLFGRGLAALYLIAFLSARNQFPALLGERGLLPVPRFLARTSFRRAPSLFHWHYSDRLFAVVAWTGIVLSAAMLLGLFAPAPLGVATVVWLVLWFAYLSIVNVGQRFYSFGWESMLVEAGFFAAFLGPEWMAPSWIPILLLRWMLLRVDLGAGLIKLRAGGPWHDWTALDYHHETQPMPNPSSWFAHHLPRPLLHGGVAFSHFVQVVVPFGLFLPQPWAGIAAGLPEGFLRGLQVPPSELGQHRKELAQPPPRPTALMLRGGPTQSPVGGLQPVSVEQQGGHAPLAGEGQEVFGVPVQGVDGDGEVFVRQNLVEGSTGLQLRHQLGHLAHGLLSTGLSHQGYLKAVQIMSLERILWELENQAPRRDPEYYLITVFGKPEAEGTWGWRFEGHHLSLNFTIVDGELIAETPAFWAANPGKVETGGRAGLRVLAGMEDLARELAQSLDEEQWKKALIADQAPRDILTGEKPKVEPLERKGILYGDLTEAQQDQLWEVIDAYLQKHRESLAEKERRDVHDEIEDVRFAWRGPLLPGAGELVSSRVLQHPERRDASACRVEKFRGGFRPRPAARAPPARSPGVTVRSGSNSLESPVISRRTRQPAGSAFRGELPVPESARADSRRRPARRRPGGLGRGGSPLGSFLPSRGSPALPVPGRPRVFPSGPSGWPLRQPRSRDRPGTR